MHHSLISSAMNELHKKGKRKIIKFQQQSFLRENHFRSRQLTSASLEFFDKWNKSSLISGGLMCFLLLSSFSIEWKKSIYREELASTRLLSSFYLVQIDWRSDNLLRLIIDSFDLSFAQRENRFPPCNHLHGAIAGQHFILVCLAKFNQFQLHFINFLGELGFPTKNKQPFETNNHKQLREILEKVAGKEIVKRDLRRHVHLLTITHSKGEEFLGVLWDLQKTTRRSKALTVSSLLSPSHSQHT